MRLPELLLQAGAGCSPLGERYEITRRPRGLELPSTVFFAPMEALPQGGAFDARYVEKPVERLTSGTYFENGDLLVSKITPSFENGKQALVRNLAAPFGYATTEVIPLRPKDRGRDRRFLFFYLLHPDVRSFVAEKMEGATGRQRVPDEVLLDLPVPDFDPAEEVLIANVLESLQQAIGVEAEAARLSQQLKRTALRELFTLGLRRTGRAAERQGIPPDWEVCSIGNHFVLSTGGTPSRANSSFWTNGKIPWVKTGEVNYRVIDQTEEHITEVGLQHSAAKLHPPGTLLIAMYGQGITRGKVAILGIEAACNQACAAFRSLDDAVATRFLYYWLTYQYDELRRFSHGGQQQNLNMDIVRAFWLAHPHDLSEQSEIVNVLEAIDKKVEVHLNKHRLLEELFKSLLHELMTGEIRVTDLDLSALEPAGPAEAGPYVQPPA